MNALFFRRFVMWTGLAVILATLPAQIALAQNDSPSSTSHRTSSLSWIRMPGAESCVPTQELARDAVLRFVRWDAGRLSEVERTTSFSATAKAFCTKAGCQI